MTNLTPIKPQEVASTSWRDRASDGYSLQQLEQLVRDCEEQPSWRENSDLSVSYYDTHGQLSELTRAKMIAEGLEPRVTNLIFRVINGVLGEEAKARSDVRVEADEDALADLCDVFNPRLKEAQRETFADMAVSNGYGSQVKAGIGWVEVARVQDPLDYPYRVADVHRNEIWWDWRAKDILYRDARWLTRMQWKDLDELDAVMPEHRQILRMMTNNWGGFLTGEMDDELSSNDRLTFLSQIEQSLRFRVRRSEWMDSARKRVKLYEVWYKVPAVAVVLHLSPTRRVLFDEKNPLHVRAVASGKVKVTKSVTRQVRMALFAGPYRLLDVGTTRRNFPYVPFIAFRDDKDQTPYGLIDGMRAPQDEYNERRQRIQWMLKAKQITVDDDALNTDFNTYENLASEAMRPDMMLVLNANRRNSEAVRIRNDLSLQKEQVEVMQDAKQLIQDVPGIYSTQLGSAPAGVTSGLAINSLVEQGMVSMGELNDNYRHSRRMVFENLLELIAEDHMAAELAVTVGQGQSKRVVVLNTFDPQTKEPVNQVKDAAVRIGLSDVPSTPAFRLQQQQQIATIIGALGGNPQAVAVLTPAFIESTSLENRKQVADDIRRATGLPTAGDRQALAAAEQQQQQELADTKALQRRALVADVAKKEVEAAKAGADLVGAEEQAFLAQQQSAATQMPQAPSEDDLINDAIAEAMAA